jgi:hypothetical protein
MAARQKIPLLLQIKSTQHLENLYSQIKASPSKGGFPHVGKRNNLFNFIFKMNNFYEKTKIKRRVEKSNHDSKR